MPLVDLNPFHWLGSAAKEVAADGFTAMMMGLWSAAMWLLQTVFGLLDRFVTPNVQDPDLRHLYEVTVWVSLVVALTIAFGQVGLAVIRHDGRSFGTLALGVVQYGLVLCGWIAGCGVLIAATAGLTSGLLHTLLDANDFSGYAAGAGFVDQVSGTVEAATLGVCALFVLIPASFGYLVIMMVRCATLLILTATLPIVAAGSLGDGTKAWLWKSVRWFLASCLTAPLLALVLGLGVQIAHAGFPDAPTGMGTATTSTGTESSSRPAEPAPFQRLAPAAAAGDQLDAERAREISGTLAEETFETSDSAANVGMSVVGCVILLIGAFAPLALFRVLAFVDPGTASGASFRSALSANGGVAGLIGRSSTAAQTGSGAATQTAPDGRTVSEASADAATANRYQSKAARVLPVAGMAVSGAMTGMAGIARQGVALGVDVLGQSGVGNQGYLDASADPSTRDQSQRRARAHGLPQRGSDEHDTAASPPSPRPPGPGAGPVRPAPAGPPGPGSVSGTNGVIDTAAEGAFLA